jgi:hypothetical protein
MTLNEFIKALEKTPRKWFINSAGNIRYPTKRRSYGHCPVSKIGGITPYNLEKNRLKLGLSIKTVYRIANAADYNYTADVNGIRKLRARLLKACGLSKDGTPLHRVR